MILQQHYLACLAQASYLIADRESGTAAVVDPRRDVELYLEEARKLGVTIRWVILTHFHADFLAGHLELREKTGATIVLGRRAQADFPFRAVGEGDEIVFGEVQLRFLETPGHTPEGISILVYDRAADAERPHGVITGDTLFVGAVGRPDLMASVGVSAEELAGMLYESLHEKLLALPDETIVYPGHGPGSACGKGMSSETTSTIGAQRRTNPALRPMDRASFVRAMTEDLPIAPAYFGYDAARNRQERPTLDAVLERNLRSLSLEQVLREAEGGALLLDTRDADAFAAGHLAGALNIGLGGQYASWAGTLLDPETPVVLVCDPRRERESALRLGRIGFDRVKGFLAGGAPAFAQRPELVAREERLDPAGLRARLAAPEPPLVLDVRTPSEWEAGHIAGALHVPLQRLGQELERVPRDRELVCVCKAGYRSSSAKSLLARHGFERLSDLRGGMDAWDGATTSCAS